MADLRSDDFRLARLLLLSHIDPLIVVEVANTAARHPKQVGLRNAVLFGTKVDPQLYSLLRQLVSGAISESFLHDMVEVITQAHIPNVDMEGLIVLGSLIPEWQVTPTPDGHRACGALHGPDGLCDLMMQPMMAFCNVFAALAEIWVKIAANVDLAKQARYRTNQPSFFDARLENLIRKELGLPTELVHGLMMNVP